VALIWPDNRLRKEVVPPWWEDVDRSIRLSIAEYEFVIERLEAQLAGTLDKSSKFAMSRKWENLLIEAKFVGQKVAQSFALAAARQRDASAVGLIPPKSRELATRTRTALAKFHVASGLARERMAYIRDEIRKLHRPRNRPSVSASPSQIDVHV